MISSNKHFTLWLAICLLLLFILPFMVACAGTSTSTTTKATASPTTTTKVTTTAATATTTQTPQYGGTLRVLTQQTIINLSIPGIANYAFDPVYSLPACEYLTVRNGADGKVLPFLATAWQPASDYSSITFTLRQGVKFQDGTDFNSAAVKYNFDPFVKSNLQTLQNVSSVDVIDNYTVRVNLKKPDITILQGYIPIGIASPTALQKLGNDATFHAVGTGPYIFNSWVRDSKLTYTRFDGYWGGKPYLDGLEFDFIADAVTQSAALQAGQGDVLMMADELQTNQLLTGGTYTNNAARTGVYGVVGNSINATSPFANLKVRQATSYAMDIVTMTKALTYGLDQPMNQFAPPSNAPGQYTYNTDIVGYPYNVAKAKQLLNDAGYPNGFTTTLTTLNQQWQVNAMQSAANYLKDVGITANLNICDTARWAQWRTSQFDGLAIFNVDVSGLADPAVSYQTVLSDMKGGRYPVVVQPTDFSDTLQQALAEPNMDKRATLLKQVNKMIIDTYCLATPLFAGTTNVIYNPKKVHDLDLNMLSASYWRPEKVWLSQ